MAVFVMEFPRFLVLMVACGIKIVCKSLEILTKIDIFLQRYGKIIFYHIFACVRAEEEKRKLMLQLDEVQLRLKSLEFSTPATKRIRHKSDDTS